MAIYASCRHEVSSTDKIETVPIAEEDRCLNRAVVYVAYCPACARKVRKWKCYLPDKEAESRWLSEGKLPYE